MRGFFSNPAPEPKRTSSKVPKALPLNCETCGLYKQVQSPKMEPYGKGRQGILNIGEGPGEVEDIRGKPWQGPVGQLLQRTYARLGVDLFEDCWNVNAVNCRPTEPAKTKEVKNRTPTPVEVSCCRAVKVHPAVNQFKPKVIVLFGYSALQSIVGDHWPGDLGQISKWRGWRIPDRGLNAWVCPTFHPSYIARSSPGSGVRNKEANAAVELVWGWDLQKAINLASKPVPRWRAEERLVAVLEQEDDVERALLSLLQRQEVFFDIETTGLKPHNPDHRIVCWSFAFKDSHGDETCYAFMHPQSDPARKALRRVLQSRDLGKGSHNMKYEHSWVREKLGYEVQNWVWDTMQAAHIRDNRTGTCGLDFQSYVHFGRAVWNEKVEGYLKSEDKKNANSLNRILELVKTRQGRLDLMTYCGVDSVMTLRLADEQRKDPMLSRRAYQLFHDGILALADAEASGIRVDKEQSEQSLAMLNRKIDKLEGMAKQSKVYQAMEKRYGTKTNLDSNTQLSTVLYQDMGITPPRVNEKSQKGSVDEEALNELHLPGLDHLLHSRKLKKIRDTYLDGFLRESFAGYIHPFFNLHIARSYRSSSDSPNLQNVPVRDEEAMRICRGVLFPRPGNRLIELDYSGVEVRVSACYHKDPVMIKYILDPTSDMHLDTAKQIFCLDFMDHRTVRSHKHLRYCAKNQFVFPEFYGSYYAACADSLCLHTGLPRAGKWKEGQGMELESGFLADHFIGVGIRSYMDFEEHIKKVEQDFWRRRFRVYTEWKERWWKSYQRLGYIEMLTGFRCVDIMSRNECINRPIQGVAFHCLLWVFSKLSSIIKREQLKSRVIGQVHDSIIVDADPEEVKSVIGRIHRLIEELREEWTWIIVPLEIEVEMAGVDEPWSEKKPWKGD